MTKTFAVYKGDELLIIGTLKECAKKLNVKEDTVKFYKSITHQNRGSGKNRRITIELEEETE